MALQHYKENQKRNLRISKAAVSPKTTGIMCSLHTPRPICRSTVYCSSKLAGKVVKQRFKFSLCHIGNWKAQFPLISSYILTIIGSRLGCIYCVRDALDRLLSARVLEPSFPRALWQVSKCVNNSMDACLITMSKL